MQNEHIPAELWKIIPAALGSFGALIWIRGTWPRRLAMGTLGCAASYYGGPWVADKMSMDPGLAGFLIGLFGMSVVDTLFRGWQALDPGALTLELVRKWLRLPAKNGE